jgi:hypothetical protein
MALKDKQGNSFSSTYLKTIHNQLSAIFNHAVRFYELKSNPARRAGNMGNEGSKEMLFWTKDEYMRFSYAMMDKPISFYAFEASESDEPIIRAVCNYINKEKYYYDTSTNLLERLRNNVLTVDITPVTLSKRLRVHADTLIDKFNIQVKFIRTSNKRILSISDGNIA